MERRRHIAPLRTNASLRRREGRQTPRPLVLIVCEGDTERHYLEALRASLRLRATEVVIPDEVTGNDPVNLVRYAEARAREQGGYDHLWCVFDRDTHARFEEARQRIRALASQQRRSIPIREAVSIPGFELWILMHFERVERPFNHCAEIIRRLREAGYIPNYEKADSALCKTLVERAGVAAGHGRWLAERAREAGFDNPYTSVHKLVTLLQGLASGQ